VYGAVGGYSVTLTVENCAGKSTTSKYGYVLVDVGSGTDFEKADPAYFSSSATSGDAPFKVTFHDDRGNGYLNTWNFGDGSQQDCVPDEQMNFQDVEHTYLVPGQYTVTLYQRWAAGSFIITKYHYITVIGNTRPTANFNSNVSSGYAPLTVQFKDLSINAIVWDWDFGDGTSSTLQNPTHTYSGAGNYRVNLTVINANGMDSKLATINILTPKQAIKQMSNTVQNLVTTGVLRKGQGNALIVKLNTATKQLNKGKKHAAANELKAFINQVSAYIKTRKLPQAEGQALIDAANVVINAIYKR
jgi:PKD repeat protein